MSRPGGVGYVLRKFPVLSETFILNELLALEARGVELQVISLQRPNDPRFHDDLPKLRARVSYLSGLSDAQRLARIHWRLARSSSLGRRYWKTLLDVALTRKPGLLWRFVQAGYVANEARRLRLRHLHAHFANGPATVALLASRITGIPFSFTAHAMDIYKQAVSREALTRKVEAARFVVTVSEFNKRYLEEITGAPEGKVVLIHNGIDLNRFAPNGVPGSARFKIICVARLVEKKGIPVLIEACRILRDRGVSLHCDIIGKGRLRPQLTSLIQDLGLRDRVHLLGPKTQSEVRERYGAAHAYVLPCILGSDGNREGLPVSIVEALACGLPVVSTPVTGIPEVVFDGHNGLLVPMGHPLALADAIQRLIDDPDLYRRLRGNARASVAGGFDHKRTSASLHRLMEGAAA